MDISQADWLKYKNKLASISQKAADEFTDWIISKGGYQYGDVTRDEMIRYAYALSTKYGEATASLAAEMYDETAALSKVIIPAAEVAETATYSEVAKAINGILKTFTTDAALGNVVGRFVKMAGADTILKNAERDGAQFAWIPAGDTCVFCLTLASNGWKYMSKNTMKNGHASHIHANCDCTFAVRFDNKTNVKGYNPDKYKAMYNAADGKTSKDKINSMRRIQYQENKDRINAQKRANYKLKKEQEDSNKKRKALNQNTLVSQQLFKTNDYSKKIFSLVGDINESRAINKCAKDILLHREGTLYEDLGFYNTITKKLYINKSYDYYKNGVSACVPNKKMRKMLKTSNDNEIIGIHNHPQSTAPSITDIICARDRGYKYGLVLCHDGKIYKYSVSKTFSDLANADFYLARLDKAVYNNNEKKITQTIAKLKELGIDMEVR